MTTTPDVGAVNEHRIVSKVVMEGDIQRLIERGVTKEWFTVGGAHRDALDFILRHREKYGSIPTVLTMRKQMGTGYEFFAVPESMEYLLDVQAEACQWSLMAALLPEVENALDRSDVDAGIDHLRTYLAKIDSFIPVSSTTVDATEEGRLEERDEEYVQRSKSKSLIGYTTGFPTIDDATLGLQPGHLVTILAQPKVGKTTISLAIANHIYLVEEQPILFVSFEMAVRELEMRMDSLMAGIPFKDLQAGTLSAVDLEKYREWLDRARLYTWPYWFTDASGGSTVGAIRAHIQRLDPSLVVLDGIYMMKDEISGEVNTSTSLTNITRSLKRLAVQADIPIIINTQALGWKSKGHRITMDSAGYSSSFAQDSDVVLGIEQIPMTSDEKGVFFDTSRMLRVLASRNSGLTQVELLFDYSEGCVEEMSTEEK